MNIVVDLSVVIIEDCVAVGWKVGAETAELWEKQIWAGHIRCRYSDSTVKQNLRNKIKNFLLPEGSAMKNGVMENLSTNFTTTRPDYPVSSSSVLSDFNHVLLDVYNYTPQNNFRMYGKTRVVVFEANYSNGVLSRLLAAACRTPITM